MGNEESKDEKKGEESNSPPTEEPIGKDRTQTGGVRYHTERSAQFGVTDVRKEKDHPDTTRVDETKKSGGTSDGGSGDDGGEGGKGEDSSKEKQGGAEKS